MPATNVETLTNPRDSLPNVYTNITARELDFVTRFGQNWDALREVLGIMRPIKKQAGTTLKSYISSITLESGDVDPGNVIPYSKATIEQVGYQDLSLKKYAKAVPVEDVDKYGVEVAVEKSDDAFLNELQTTVMDDFYGALTGDASAMTGAYATFQMAVSMAIGKVKDKFKRMHKNVSSVVVFVNTLDVYSYLGAADISIQNLFGIEYVKDFLGAQTMIISSEIESGKVIAVPSDNLVLYYVDPSTEFARLGLVYTTDGETNLIGFHAQGNYGTAVGESFALMGMKLWFEYADGVAIVDIDDSFLTDLTVAPDAADKTYPWTDKTPSDFQSDVAVSGGKITGELKFMEGGLSPSGPLSGDGYFLALKFDNFSSGLTYANVKVGLQPSAGTGLVTLDSDKDAVFKISDKNTQKLKTVQEDANGHKNIQYFDLSSLELEDPEGV